jgi:DNA-binding transcriptional LysR family regulator
MDMDGLRAFVRVAEYGNFSRAAVSLHLAQPAVSQQVKRLERDLGAQVFLRSTRRVQLTAAGEVLLPRAKAILAEASRAQEDVRMLGEGLAGRVSIGFVGTATYDLLPRVSRSVRAALPGVELEVYGEQLTPALVERLLAHDLDVAVMRNPEPGAPLAVAPLRSERLICALPADHPAAGNESVELAALSEEPFVTYPSGRRSVTYEAVMQACRQVGFVPREVVEVRETATLVAFVAAGIGVALVPEPVRSLAVEGVAFRALSDVDHRTELVVASRMEGTSAAVGQVVRLVQAAGKEASTLGG